MTASKTYRAYALLGNMACYQAGDGVVGVVYNVHDESRCYGRPCVVHNRTDHHMVGFPLHWRNDRLIFERICPHDVGHPDPDQFHYWREMGVLETESRHGCDGCCTPPPEVEPDPSDPLYDPDGIDPDGDHLRGLVDAMDRGIYAPGAVCRVYELCGHPLCAASYALWVELDRARVALRGES